MLKEFDDWLYNPVAMTRKTLLVNTKGKSVKVRLCFSNDLLSKIERMINVEPAKAVMLIKGTRQLRDEEKVELFKSQWKQASKANMSKIARSLPADMIANIWKRQWRLWRKNMAVLLQH